jgi:hypothetical protein
VACGVRHINPGKTHQPSLIALGEYIDASRKPVRPSYISRQGDSNYFAYEFGKFLAWQAEVFLENRDQMKFFGLQESGCLATYALARRATYNFHAASQLKPIGWSQSQRRSTIRSRLSQTARTESNRDLIFLAMQGTLRAGDI